MFNGDAGVVFKNPPCRSGVYVIKENDRRNLLHDLIIKIFERGAQLVRVGVFAVHYQYGLLTVIYEVVDIVFYKSPCIGDFTVFREGVAMPLIKQGSKLLVIIEDITLVHRYPVDVHLIGVVGETCVIDVRSIFRSVLCQAVWHNEQLFYVRPVNPDWKEAFAVVNAV